MCGGNSLGCVKCHTFAGPQGRGRAGHRHAADAEAPATRLVLSLPARSAKVAARHAHAHRLAQRHDRPAGRARRLDGQADRVHLGLSARRRQGRSAAGTEANTPSRSMPDKEAIIYRNFIEGSGSRAIGVGYPEKANLAFDANELRLALIWQGEFIDAARHWTDRGAGFEPPLGENVLHLPSRRRLRRAGQGRRSLADQVGQRSWATSSAATARRRTVGRPSSTPVTASASRISRTPWPASRVRRSAAR